MSLSHLKGANNDNTITSSSHRSEIIKFSKQISRQSAKAVYTVPGTVHVQYIS